MSYEMFCKGMSMEEIAKSRDLVTGTIATHLEHYVRMGKIKLEQVVAVEKIEKIDLFNPSQYITKNGVVSPGSSGRYHVEFRLQDDTHIELSVSAKQAGKFELGMRGTLVHRRNILMSFVPDV